jgi:tRNA-specific 2-thiouridylase
MSGGVDSSMAAALLKERGYNVIGLTMRLWPAVAGEGSGRGSAAWAPAVADARRVAEALGIDHHVVDLEHEFRELVVDGFCGEYSRGRTPNPCVICNSLIKFGLLMRRAVQLGADLFATGHYARVRYDRESGRHLLLKGKDPQKDQSYVLYRLNQDQLSRLRFPLGCFTKEEVRSLAERSGLPIASKKESQEICFIPDGDYRSFLRRRSDEVKPALREQAEGRAPSRGLIVDTSGRVLGRHSGIERFTVGQRKGLGVSSDRRLYVVAIDAAIDRVVVGEEHELYAQELTASECNWVSIEEPRDGMLADAKIRYSSEAVPAVVRVGSIGPGSIRVAFERPVRAVTPGQSVVLYDGYLLLGGGIIESSTPLRAGNRSVKGDAGAVSNP